MRKRPSNKEFEKYNMELQNTIHEHKLALKELQKYRNIISSTTDGFALLDSNYRYVLVNDAYENFSGISRESFLGLTVAEYLGKDVFEQNIKAHFDRCLSGEVVNYQGQFNYPSLGSRFVDVTYFPYRDENNRVAGVIANTRVITDYWVTKEALSNSESLYRLVMESVSEPIFITDNNGNFTFICENVKHSLGYTAEELKALGNVSKLAGGVICDFDELKKKAEIRNIERTVQNKDGSERIFSIDLKPVCIQGGTVLHTWHDITKRKKVEEKLFSSLAEKDILLQELYHRTQNTLQIVSSILRLQAAKVPDNKQVQKLVNDAEHKIMAIALVHHKIYQSSDLCQFPH